MHKRGFTLIELLVVIAIIALIVGLLMPAVQQAREAARRTQCKNNLHQIGLGLHNYQSTHNVFPPGVLGDTGSVAANQSLHAWPTLILPFVEQVPLHNQYNFSVRFDHANNAAVVKTFLPVYLCPSIQKDLVGNQYAAGHYAGNAGTIPGQNDGVLFPFSVTSFQSVVDGTANTIAVGELAYDVGGWARGANNTGGGGGGGGGGGAGQGFARAVLRWWVCAAACARPGMNPPVTACSNSCEQSFQFSSLHTGGGHFVFVDGHGRFVNENIDVTVFRRLLTRNGREVVGDF